MPPMVILAALCKWISQDEDDFLTVHGIVHGLTILDEGPAGIDLQAVVRIMSDEPGTYPFRAGVVSPSGQPASAEFRTTVTLGVFAPRTMTFALQVQPDEEGLFWFEVEIGQEPVTRIPLGVRWAPDSR